MEYGKNILLNWLFYNNNLTYGIKAKAEIIKFVYEYYEDMLLACSYLSFKKQNSTKIFLAVDNNKLKEYIFEINKKIIDNSHGSVTDLFSKINSYKEMFFSDNVNKFRKNIEENVEDSYLEVLLIKWFTMTNIYPKDSNEYFNFLELIQKYGNEVIDTLFINQMGSNRIYKYFINTLSDKNFEEFADYVHITTRNFEINHKEKYHILKNKFILALEDTISLTHEEFSDLSIEEEREMEGIVR